MSEHDAKTYNELYARIEKQSRTLRTVIDSLEAKEKERQWVRHQTTGDLDDAKLVEGVTGEKTIYRLTLPIPLLSPPSLCGGVPVEQLYFDSFVFCVWSALAITTKSQRLDKGGECLTSFFFSMANSSTLFIAS